MVTAQNYLISHELVAVHVLSTKDLDSTTSKQDRHVSEYGDDTMHTASRWH